MKSLIMIVVFSCLQTMPLIAGGVHEAPPLELKKGGAVSAFSEEDGFKLTNPALKHLGISFQTLSGSGPWQIPKAAIVRIKHATGVYRKWDGWITLVLVDIVAKKDETVKIKSVDLQDGDEIAVTGAAFLRMTEADLNADTVDACTH